MVTLSSQSLSFTFCDTNLLINSVLKQFSLVKLFAPDTGYDGDSEEDEPQAFNLRVISSTWLNEDKTKCWWPPASIAMDRAGRMAANHATPDPKTWQHIDVSVEGSYRTYGRGLKNLKALEKGMKAEGDKTTDYERPRIKRRPTRLVEEDDEIKAPKRKKSSAPAKSRFGSDSDDSTKTVPAPVFNKLEEKLNKVIARRAVQVKPNASQPKEKSSKVVVPIESQHKVKGTETRSGRRCERSPTGDKSVRGTVAKGSGGSAEVSLHPPKQLVTLGSTTCKPGSGSCENQPVSGTVAKGSSGSSKVSLHPPKQLALGGTPIKISSASRENQVLLGDKPTSLTTVDKGKELSDGNNSPSGSFCGDHDTLHTRTSPGSGSPRSDVDSAPCNSDHSIGPSPSPISVPSHSVGNSTSAAVPSSHLLQLYEDNV
ncbi:uncharacterized protein LOC113207591 isoform X4 [Frankliniella occidentalis]|uniref:Uncharacterized protein LOC113207591 isoform X4 n=1 Tax=Frankliniella occidentalis TaxID=133901 RepID=A0A9C6WSP4_FRAOC|nr:uncharacterized protein LOC113207591 isoform X4 [Frankliniella occidentalis]